jgi:hypothetical protein
MHNICLCHGDRSESETKEGAEFSVATRTRGDQNPPYEPHGGQDSAHS